MLKISNLDCYQSLIDAEIESFQKEDFTRRIFNQDHTLWQASPIEASNRLGWLNVIDSMSRNIATIENFVSEISDFGYQYVVLMGMGGSSLGPAVINRVFGNITGHFKLIVLDSTVPEAIRRLVNQIDISKTLFLVSSKSGNTLETNNLYNYFRDVVETKLGSIKAGEHFVAITDSGTSLNRLADTSGFRHVFENPSDIGGRYSILSYFGLVPAALLGVDIEKLLNNAKSMRRMILDNTLTRENSPVFLGSVMGVLSLAGRDKLTISSTGEISAMGPWIEQLISESLGKNNKGLIPINIEKVMEPDCYDDDRFFVHFDIGKTSLQEDISNLESIEESGHPVLRISLNDRYDLGGEFVRWQFMTAVAGSVIGVNPFNQPNVEASKKATKIALTNFTEKGALPKIATITNIYQLLRPSVSGGYLSIMAYLDDTPALCDALSNLQDVLINKRKITSTVGFGPSFLHSTGQMHKGGPDKGVFLQLLGDNSLDIDIPGQSYSFGQLAHAQAAGDFQTLITAGKKVFRINIQSDPVSYIDNIATSIEEI